MVQRCVDCLYAYTGQAMLDSGTLALMKAEIARLEEAPQECPDQGIRQVMDGSRNRKKLAEGMKEVS